MQPNTEIKAISGSTSPSSAPSNDQDRVDDKRRSDESRKTKSDGEDDQSVMQTFLQTVPFSALQKPFSGGSEAQKIEAEDTDGKKEIFLVGVSGNGLMCGVRALGLDPADSKVANILRRTGSQRGNIAMTSLFFQEVARVFNFDIHIYTRNGRNSRNILLPLDLTNPRIIHKSGKPNAERRNILLITPERGVPEFVERGGHYVSLIMPDDQQLAESLHRPGGFIGTPMEIPSSPEDIAKDRSISEAANEAIRRKETEERDNMELQIAIGLSEESQAGIERLTKIRGDQRLTQLYNNEELRNVQRQIDDILAELKKDGSESS
jgi:hypothetical protein